MRTHIMTIERKIEPVVRILDEEDHKGDLEYWLRKTPEERIEAVLHLREQYIISLGFSSPPAIEPCVKIISP